MSGFKEPNYTQTPNELFDEFMSKMGNAELRVVLAIVRKTMGWHKKKDMISLSQLVELTGMTRESVISGIAAATERGLIRRSPKRNSFEYELVLVGLADQKSRDSRPFTSRVNRHTKETNKNNYKKTTNHSLRDENQPTAEGLKEIRLRERRERELAEERRLAENAAA